MERERPMTKKKGDVNGEDMFTRCAEFVLPWLFPSDLASVASTCKTLNTHAKSITSRRSSDASRSLENLPIPFANSAEGHPYTSFFYTPSQILAINGDAPHVRQPWGNHAIVRPATFRGHMDSSGSSNAIADHFPLRVEGARGCDCENCDDEDSECPCLDMSSSELIWECGPSCRCGYECGNRVTQRGIVVRLKIVKDKRKGWGLRAGELIQGGQFVCEYAGELLTTREARIRQKRYDELAFTRQLPSALLVVREHLPSGNACMRINIDATRIGNIAKFINHSCDGGNLSMTLVRCSGSLLPRLCFFASKSIGENNELTFSYGDVRVGAKGMQCFCDSSCCLGTLPSEHT